MKRIIILIAMCLLFVESHAERKVFVLSHYIFPDFTMGVVQMKDGRNDKLLLNYNMITEEMLFKDNGKILAIGKEEIDKIDFVKILKKKFVVLNGKFVEQLYHGFDDLYAEYKCSVIPPGKPSGYGQTSETSAAQSYSGFYSLGSLYHELKLPDGYVTKPYVYYWIKKDGKLQKVLTIRQVVKMYKSKKDLFKDYVKENKVKFENPASMAKLIEYLEKI